MALRRRSRLMALCCLAIAAAFLAAPATAVGKTGQVTVFWGRNKAEGTLREACDTGRYTIAVISFHSVFGHGRYWDDLSGHPLAGVGDDIKHCQSRSMLVFLSIGGGGGQYSLPSSQSAADVADHLWNAYFAGRRAGVPRPFGEAEVDGVDFFIDNGSPEHYDELARRLYNYNKPYRATVKVQLSATPRCAYPDRRVEAALRTGLFSRIHVRFYDDPSCSYNHAGLAGVMEQWNKWTAANTVSQVYLGLAASNLPGKNDMVDLKALYGDLLPNVQKSDNYGGIMVWNRYLDKQTNYASTLKDWA